LNNNLLQDLNEYKSNMPQQVKYFKQNEHNDSTLHYKNTDGLENNKY